MGEAIVITSGKGGVGKTTTTANLGLGLALAGKRVAMVDADIGLRNLDVVMGLENRIVYDMVDVVEHQCKLKQALIRDKRTENLFLLPAAQTRDKTEVSSAQMRALIGELKQEFDYVLIDCPAGIEHGFKNAIIAADMALIVTVPEVPSVRDADRIIGLLFANEMNHIRLIVNRVRPEMIKSGDVMSVDDVIEILSIDLIGIIPEDDTILRASNLGEPVVLAAKSPAGLAYRDTVKRLMGETVPLQSYSASAGLFGKLRKIFAGT